MTLSEIPPYSPQAIEAKWQTHWAKTGLYQTPAPAPADQPTFYCLDFFPYPSGAGLSVGHGRNYVPTDIISRFHRMRGHTVLHPMGWDAFGLPAENEAIKRGTHPRETTTRYAQNYRQQLDMLGCSYDWSREINSSSADYYRWTQWFFLLLQKRGLAYQATGRQWWCEDCKTVLANEQVENGGLCWRCGQQVYKREMKQWYFRITAYAEELLSSIEDLDWPDHILAMQRTWIGRSEGVEFTLPIVNSQAKIDAYTTRPDTIFGMTFVVLAPEHPLVKKITSLGQQKAVQAYCQAASYRSEVERQQNEGERQGIFTGAYAINPVNQVEIPIYVADYVLMDYGTGAIMAVPAHDERDFDFAQRYNLPILPVIQPPSSPAYGRGAGGEGKGIFTGNGTLINSGPWTGQASHIAKSNIITWLEEKGIGQGRVQYRLRDWLISRQRYWGAPIPIIHCPDCGSVPVPDKDLPVRLPKIDSWEPGDDGRSPLANVPEFVNTTCPHCGQAAQRETDTMDGFACSSWYFLRFVSPSYGDGPFEPWALAQFGPPDLYVGGAEHAVMHLLYARFWTKVMADAGLIDFREPFPRLRSQGVMHAREADTGEVRRMSKSKGNVVRPDVVAQSHGADALRLYLSFMAPFEHNTIWDEAGLNGTQRFLNKVWRLAQATAPLSPCQGEGLGVRVKVPTQPNFLPLTQVL